LPQYRDTSLNATVPMPLVGFIMLNTVSGLVLACMATRDGLTDPTLKLPCVQMLDRKMSDLIRL